MERCTVLFRGRVQGVGFRWTVCRVARRFSVTGWVRNERDGSVCVVAEGERPEIQAFVAGIREAMAGYIDSADTRWSDPTGEFAAFDVRY